MSDATQDASSKAGERCRYIGSAPQDLECGRQAHLEGYCWFHLGANLDKEDEPERLVFQRNLDDEISRGNGNWNGFYFPKGIVLPKQIPFPIRARNAQFEDLALEGVEFQCPVDFSHSRFHGTTTFNNCRFLSAVTFDEAMFEGPLNIQGSRFDGAASLHQCDFQARTLIRHSTFKESFNANSSIFRESIQIHGWRVTSGSLRAGIEIRVTGSKAQLTLSTTNIKRRTLEQVLREAIANARLRTVAVLSQCKKLAMKNYATCCKIVASWHRRLIPDESGIQLNRVFEGDVQLSQVIFAKPDAVVFSQVDFSKAYLVGTNLRGVRLLDVKWSQRYLGRRGLYDEVFALKSQDAAFQKYYWPLVEETYRNVRVALEDNKAYQDASDFYIGEMEARRKQFSWLRRNFFAVGTWYKAATRYGTSVGFALWNMLLLAACYFLITVSLAGTADIGNEGVHVLVGPLRRTLDLLTLQGHLEVISSDSPLQFVVDALFRVLFAIQAALIVIAFRNQIKRH